MINRHVPYSVPMKRKMLVISAVAPLLASVLLLGGCSALGSSAGSSSSGPLTAPAGGADSAPADSAPADSAAGRDAATLVPGAQIVTTGTISLHADEPIDVADSAVALTTSLGGHVDNRAEQSSGDVRADLVLRIPSARVTEAIDRLKTLAVVDSVALTATDVTAQASDVDARVTALGTSVARLLDLMSKATSTTDLIALESTLAERQADLDSLVAQRAALTDTVAYSSISVSIEDSRTAPATGPGDFWSGLGTGWSSLVAAIAGALVVFGVALPWLVAFAVIAAVVLLVIRLASRRGHVAGTVARPDETSS